MVELAIGARFGGGVNASTAFRISAGIGFLAVALGAFGAHGLEDVLARNDPKGVWKTAALYHLVHSVVLLMVASREPFRKAAWWLFASGVGIFSGTLYVYAVTGMKWLAMITPAGGVCLLAGWALLALKR